MAIIKQQFTITYEREIDSNTGEIIKTSIVKTSDKTTKRESVKTDSIEEDNEPKLYLEDSKCKLNQAAINLMSLEAGDKVDIKYEQDKAGIVPLIGKDEYFGTKGGNKLSKTNTIACRGIKNSELAKYGKEFTIVKHPSKEGLFILTSGNKVETIEEDINIDDLIEDTTEITSDFFKL